MNTCTAPDCTREIRARGLCASHYMSARHQRIKSDPTAKRTRGACTLDGCAENQYARGWCVTHYSRWRRTGDPLGRFQPTEVRFWRFVAKTDTCWLWTGATASGYGLFWDERQVRAHRWAYESEVGPIPEGLQLDHLCRVPLCVRPDHLEPVTGAENMRRMWLARRADQEAS